MNTTDDLTRSLRRAGGPVGGHPIDFESVRGRARSIQRRRRVAAGAGVLAAVAVIAPIAVAANVGCCAATTPRRRRPEVPSPTPVGQVEAIGADAPRGADPAVPWLDGTVLHQPDGSTTDLGTAYYEVTPYDGGWAAVDLVEGTTSFLDADGKVRQTFDGQSLAVSSDGQSLASVLSATAGDQDIGLYPVSGRRPGWLPQLGGLRAHRRSCRTSPASRRSPTPGPTRQGQSGAWLTDWAQ